jgi:hypothetical protein
MTSLAHSKFTRDGMRDFEVGANRAKQHAAASAMVTATFSQRLLTSKGHATLRKRIGNIERYEPWNCATHKLDPN